MFTLCAPKPLLLSQKSLYGAPAGGTGGGKYDTTFGFFGSATSISDAWLGPSSQLASEFVSTIFRVGNGSAVWTANKPRNGGSKVSSLISFGCLMSLMSSITNFVPNGRYAVSPTTYGGPCRPWPCGYAVFCAFGSFSFNSGSAHRETSTGCAGSEMSTMT